MKVTQAGEQFVCTMSKAEFVGVFRGIGGIGFEQRSRSNARLTEEENDAVFEAFREAFDECEEVRVNRV